jgi:hypothetical protein
MGQELVYCFKCGNKIKAADFDKGAAFRISDKTCCSTCAVGLLTTLSQEEQNAILQKVGKSKESATPPPAAHAPAHKITTIRKATQRGEVSVRKSNPMPIVIVVGLIVVIGAAIMIGSSSRRASPRVVALQPPEPVIPQGPSKPDTPDLPPVKGPNVDGREATAQKALDAARAANPNDLPAKIKAYRSAVWESEKTSVFDVATKELAAWLEKWRRQIESDLAAVDEKMRGQADREEFKSALDALFESRNKYADVEWTVPIDQRVATLKKSIDDKFKELKDQAIAARKRGEDVKKITERVAGWGLKDYREILEDALDDLADADEPPKPPPPPPPVNNAVYREAWGQAMSLASIRQFYGAAKILQQFASDEGKADLELLRGVRVMYDETQDLVDKWPEGRSLPLSYVDDSGAVKSTKDDVNFADRYVIEYKKAGYVPVSDVTADSLLKLRKDKGLTVDDRTAALFLLLGGMTADTSLLPEKYRTYVAPKRAKSEKAARELFGKAAKEYRYMATRAESVEKYKSLLNNHTESELVKRNEDVIRARSVGDKECYLDATQMKFFGTFKMGKTSAGEPLLVNDTDSDSKSRDNYVEFEFYAMANTPYRVLARIATCCQESGPFTLQMTELKGTNSKREQVLAEPGGQYAMNFNPRNDRMGANHGTHGPRKEPTVYGWILLANITFTTSGVKKARIISTHAGFGVRFAMATAEQFRDQVPTVQEFRALLKQH